MQVPMRSTAAVCATVLVTFAAPQHALSQNRRFEVASVKPCDAGASEGFRGAGGISSPGMLSLNCLTLRNFIVRAYVYYRDGHFSLARPLPPIEGAPGWMDSDRYTITAKPEGAVSEEIANGPMLQALLEDRFKLAIRRETKQVPVYEMTAARGGARLLPFVPGACIPLDWSNPPKAPEHPSDPKPCPCDRTRKDTDIVIECKAVTLDMFSILFLRLDHLVINKTGISGLLNFHFEYPAEESGQTSPSFAALQQQLGLRLVSAKGPGEFLVIDHVERPSAN